MSERSEHDSMGDVSVPEHVYHGAQSQRAKENFAISGRGLPANLIHALGRIKAAAARVNGELGLLSLDWARAIADAADEVAAGRLDDHFVVDVFQTGSGTSTNMNANEVIAKRADENLTGKRHASEPIHPNDHVNLGQSSNDVFPTAIHLAALLAIDGDLLPALELLHRRLAKKASAFMEIVKIGRTHLQDALPIRLGQEFAGYARMIERGRELVQQTRPMLKETALGGTAVGTGSHTHPEFARRVLKVLNEQSGLSLCPAPVYFEALGSRHAIVAASGALKTLAVDLMKIANDLRLLSSGPRCGLGEIALPALQPGSSMMPGKVNPVIPEAVCQVAAQVIGNDLAITIGGQAGLLELNVMMPMMADNLLSSIRLLANATRLFAERCVAGIEARPERCEEFVEESMALATALVPRIGYDRAARLVQQAYREGRTIREIAQRESGLSAEELNALLDTKRMSRPEVSERAESHELLRGMQDLMGEWNEDHGFGLRRRGRQA